MNYSVCFTLQHSPKKMNHQMILRGTTRKLILVVSNLFCDGGCAFNFLFLLSEKIRVNKPTVREVKLQVHRVAYFIQVIICLLSDFHSRQTSYEQICKLI